MPFDINTIADIVRPHHDKLIAEGKVAKLERENARLRAALSKITYDTPHTVVLSVNDWLGIQSQLGFAAQQNDEQGDHATAIVQRELLGRLREQTQQAIDAAAEDEP